MQVKIYELDSEDGKRPNTKASINYKCEVIYEVRALVEVNDK